MITLDPRSSKPIYEQIVDQMKELVAKGILAPGDKIPSVRELAELVMANPNTVSKAYQELERLGAIETLRGKGTFVAQDYRAEMNPQLLDRVKEQLRGVVVDASFMGMSREDVLELVKIIYREVKRG